MNRIMVEALRRTEEMDQHINLDYKEGERACRNMLSTKQESSMIVKSSWKSNGEKDLSLVSTSSSGTGMIRVIHIFAPKIIKTDVANFRELVQRLTGNTKRSRSGSRSGSKCKRSAKSVTSSLSGTQKILSQYSNATKIFASSSHLEYCIPRSPDSHFSTPHILDFCQQEEDVKPRIRQPSYIDFSTSSSDQSCCSPILPFAEVTSPAFHGHESQELDSIDVDSNDDIPNSTMRNRRMQQQQQKKVPTSASIMVDPFQSLSGYRERLPPTPQTSSTSAFPSHFDERSHSMSNNRFSDIDTLAGLVTPRALRGLALPPHVTNTSSDFTFQSSLLNNSNGLCRFSVQSSLQGGIQQMFDNSSSFLA